MVFNIELLDFKKPYEGKRGSKNRTAFSYKEYGGKAGLYFIKENNELVYIGTSKCCVYKAMYRHFQLWDSARLERDGRKVTYKHEEHEYEVAIVTVKKIRAHQIETFNIKFHEPRDNEKLIENGNREIDNTPEDDVPF